MPVPILVCTPACFKRPVRAVVNGKRFSAEWGRWRNKVWMYLVIPSLVVVAAVLVAVESAVTGAVLAGAVVVK